MPLNEQGKMVFPYLEFGFRLWRLREARGLRSNQVADYLGIPLQQYRKYETGECLPEPQMLLELSRILKVDLVKLKAMDLSARRKSLEDTPVEGGRAYSDQLNAAIERAKKRYQDETGRPLSAQQRSLFGHLKNDLYKCFVPPVLPVNCFLVLSAVQERGDRKKYPHEIDNFVADGETLAGFLAREPLLGAFMYFAANLFYFPDNPSQNMQDCFNRLTTEQLKELFLLMTAHSGIYAVEEESAVLQKKFEYCGLGALFVLELKSALPQNINFNHLFMSVLLQGIGTYVLYTILQPSLKGRGEETIEEVPGAYAGLNRELFDAIDHELHPVVSAIVATNWKFPREVVDTVLLHHHQPVKEVTPLCAALKIVNFFPDCDFPDMSKEDLASLMQAYSQVDIPIDAFFDATVKLQKMKDKLIERTSSMLEEKNQLIADYVTEKKRRLSKNNFTAITPKRPYTGSDVRFDPEYVKVIVSALQELVGIVEKEKLFHQNKEGLAPFLDRIARINLMLHYLLNQDIQAIAEEFKIPREEVLKRLRLK